MKIRLYIFILSIPYQVRFSSTRLIIAGSHWYSVRLPYKITPKSDPFERTTESGWFGLYTVRLCPTNLDKEITKNSRTRTVKIIGETRYAKETKGLLVPMIWILLLVVVEIFLFLWQDWKIFLQFQFWFWFSHLTKWNIWHFTRATW